MKSPGLSASALNVFTLRPSVTCAAQDNSGEVMTLRESPVLLTLEPIDLKTGASTGASQQECFIVGYGKNVRHLQREPPNLMLARLE